MLDKWIALQRRCQNKEEHVMDYYQSKVKLCRNLKLSFTEIRDHVIQGFSAKDIAMFALSYLHCNETELLGDLIEWTRMNGLRGVMVKKNRVRDTKSLEVSVHQYKTRRNQNHDRVKK